MGPKLGQISGGRDNNFSLLRFLAASLVLYSHAFVISTGDPASEPLRNSLGMTLGTIAVDIFFVTSGFLVSASFFNRKSTAAFIWARFLRIFPALFAALIVITFIIGGTTTSLSAREYFTSSEIYSYLARNTVLFFGIEYELPGVFTNNPYKQAVNGSLWTLPHEVRMYTLLVLVCSLLSRFEVKNKDMLIARCILTLAILGLTLFLAGFESHLLSDNFFRLFGTFFSGAAFYCYQDKIRLDRVCFSILIISLIICAIWFRSTFAVLYYFSVSYLVLYIAYMPKGFIRNFNRLGDYSYGIYIYAFPVQQFIVFLAPGICVTAMTVGSSVITFTLAYFSWRLIEEPSLKFKVATREIC